MPATLQATWIDEPIDYDGSQLRGHWILQQCGLVGDAIVGFRGACSVRTEEIADLADLEGPGIAGADMLHLLWESFAAPDLLLSVHRQRLLSAQAAELLRAEKPGIDLRRDGDDLYVGTGKLSISIATVTPVSSLIHFALNVTTAGTPVETAALGDLGIDPREFGQKLLERVVDEQESIAAARAVVRPKGEWR